MSGSQLPSVLLANEIETQAFAEDLALAIQPGDCIALSGNLGAGKSTLARAMIRSVADDDQLEVPSPTFTIVQLYDLRIPIAHFDLYRLGSADELDELGLEDALQDGVALIEWPERADILPPDTVWIRFEIDGDQRKLEISGDTEVLSRIERSMQIRAFLKLNHKGSARRGYLQGDASTRSYELLHMPDGDTAVLMNAPPKSGGPVVRDGKTYPQLVHLAQDVGPFIAIGKYLQTRGFRAPRIDAADIDQGFLVLEDLGVQGVLDQEGRPIDDRYLASVEVLAALHHQQVEPALPVHSERNHSLKSYDPAIMLFESELLLDWYWQFKHHARAPLEARQTYLAIMEQMLAHLVRSEQNLVLRDFHSPNILWRAEATGLDRVGLIDFQDALIGPSAYDVASIIHDARVTIRPELQASMVTHYLDLRSQDLDFDVDSFHLALAIIQAQRACKLLGLFVRLDQRDGKPDYLDHLPRIQGYLRQALCHCALRPLREWFLKAGMLPDES